MSCRLQTTSSGHEIACEFSPHDAITVYFYPSVGPQRPVVNCLSADECYNDEGFILKRTSGSTAYILVPPSFSETGKFLCQNQDLSPESAMFCLWPLKGNDASDSSYAGSTAHGYGITILVVLLILSLLLAILGFIKWPTIKLKIKTSKIWTLCKKMSKNQTRGTCANNNCTNSSNKGKKLLEEPSEKIEGESFVPPCESVSFRDVTTKERMKELDENTVAREEVKDFLCYSDIDMPRKTPVQKVRETTEVLEEVDEDVSHFGISSKIDTPIQRECGEVGTTLARGTNSDVRIQVESDSTEASGEVEEDVFSFSDIDMDRQGVEESVVSLRREVTVENKQLKTGNRSLCTLDHHSVA